MSYDDLRWDIKKLNDSLERLDARVKGLEEQWELAEMVDCADELKRLVTLDLKNHLFVRNGELVLHNVKFEEVKFL